MNFDWPTIRQPPRIAENLVVHELVHVIKLNHSKEFWEQEARVLPDYAARKEWVPRKGWHSPCVSNDTVTFRAANRSSNSRKLKVNRWYSQTVWLMISGGKR